MPIPQRIGYINATTGGTTQATSITINPDAPTAGSPVAVDDWMIAIISINAHLTDDAITPPEGWTTIRDDWGAVGTFRTKIYARCREATDSVYTFTNTTAKHLNACLLWVRGAAPLRDWIIGTPKGRQDSPTETTTATAPSITTTQADIQVLSLLFERTIANEVGVTWSGADQWLFAPQVGSSISTISVGFKEMTLPGETGAVVVTYPNPQAVNGWGLQIGIPPEAGSSAEGLAVKISNGTDLVDARFKLADGDGGVYEAGGYKIVRSGYTSVSEMLAQDTFYIAHRGGSLDFPEMSLYAYGQSALLGYPALELSIARTADGVFFGLHDYRLDRTSGVTGVDPTTMTWAQVQQYEILGSLPSNNPGQPNRSYMRWEELIDVYYHSHVLFIDPKSLSQADRMALLDRMDALPNSTDRFVGKYYGVSGNIVNSSGPAKEFADRGYSRWGYFYETDMAELAAYEGRWDILGMEYIASESAWAAIKSYSKPVVGHIVRGNSSAAIALSKGADGLMVAGVRQVMVP